MTRPRFHVLASKSALAAAERLGLGRCVENLVEEGILAGRVTGQGTVRWVEIDGGHVATVLRLKDSTPQGRRKLLVQRIERAPGLARYQGGRR